MSDYDLKDLDIITGHPQLDFEHAQIIHSLNQLHDSTLSQSMRIVMCENLLHYISDHCKDEESLMELYEYPLLQEHIEAHAAIQEGFLKNIGAFIMFGASAGDRIHIIFYNHIINVDIPFINYMKEQDLKNK